MPKFQLSFRKFSKKTSNRIWIVIDVQKRKKKGSIANQDNRDWDLFHFRSTGTKRPGRRSRYIRN